MKVVVIGFCRVGKRTRIMEECGELRETITQFINCSILFQFQYQVIGEVRMNTAEPWE